MIRKVPKADSAARVADILRLIRLEGYERRKPSQLSGGQRLREEMQVELKAIQREVGITFIYVTHDQQEALTMSDRIAVFNNGRIEQIGTPGEIYEQPEPAFVAGFVGTSNLLPA